MREPDAEMMEMVEDYADAGEQLEKAKVELATITRQRTEKIKEVQALESRQATIRRDFETTTGLDIRKYLRPATVQAVEKAIGALTAAMCPPGNLPITDPIVQKRLADLRDAINARIADKEARRQAREEVKNA